MKVSENSIYFILQTFGAAGCNLLMSKVYSLKATQKLPIPIEEAWDFFSRPDNLKDITPTHLGFNIISQHHGKRMFAGQIIEYKVSPLLGIPLYWMTEITHVEEGRYFVDEQRYGPYSLWHHQHHFKSIDGGVEMTDIVHYKLPLWFVGDIAHGLFVKKQLQSIFSFRFQKAEALFGKWQEPALAGMA
jgi:ligand-binding SRPBCC domain-containing protein